MSVRMYAETAARKVAEVEITEFCPSNPFLSEHGVQPLCQGKAGLHCKSRALLLVLYPNPHIYLYYSKTP